MKTKKSYRYLFGPVPSRRFGRSLGVDITPFKTCSFDCIFCQLGRTTQKTLTRREYVPVGAVMDELNDWLKNGGEADVITLSGSGEPTLHSEFGRVIEFVRKATSIPVVLLTNGSLLGDPDVRSQAAQAHVVKASLSAWDQFSLDHINRPHRDVEFEKIIEGQRAFRKAFKGELWMEVFLVWGTNTVRQDVTRIADLAKTIGPDRIHLNTSVRPPCEEYACSVPAEQMDSLSRLFDPLAEVLAEYGADISACMPANEIEVLNMLRRRPCTLGQISKVFGLHRNEVLKRLGKLIRTGQAREQRGDGETFYIGVHLGGTRHANL